MKIMTFAFLGFANHCSTTRSVPTFRGVPAKSVSSVNTPRGVALEMRCQHTLKQYLSIFLLIGVLSLLVGCSVKTIPYQYTIHSFSHRILAKKASSHSILVTQTEATASFQTEQMLYTTKRYQLAPFAKHGWITSPANLFYPLIIQSLQQSHYFHAIISGVYADNADYRLDTQIIELYQDFLVKPSQIKFKIKATLTRTEDASVIASKIFTACVPSSSETPYGGVTAANKAAQILTADITEFAINALR